MDEEQRLRLQAEAHRQMAAALDGLAALERGEGRWPDGLPVHDVCLYVRLGCGHERVARGWRGHEGATYCCDACHKLTVMEEISMTDEQPYDWRMATAST